LIRADGSREGPDWLRGRQQNWPLAKIEKLIEGRDGVARVAVLKTKDGILKRPLQRIYPLEICSNDVNGSVKK